MRATSLSRSFIPALRLDRRLLRLASARRPSGLRLLSGRWEESTGLRGPRDIDKVRWAGLRDGERESATFVITEDVIDLEEVRGDRVVGVILLVGL